MAHCDTEMIDEVDEVLENLNVTSEYRASLAWRSTADLDIYVKITATEELIYYRSKVSADGNTYLDVDQIPSAPAAEGEPHVENVSFNSTGTYEVFVNNHNSNNDVGEIPFTVVIRRGSQSETVRGTWDIGEMGTVTNADLSRMLRITTIHIEAGA